MNSLKCLMNKIFKSKIVYRRVLSGILAFILMFSSVDFGGITSLAATVNGLEVSLQWVGAKSDDSITWKSSKDESKIITMQVNYRYNQGASSQGFPIGSIIVDVPGIGRANRAFVKQADAVVDNLGNDKTWGYTYNASNDTYTFKNIKEIDNETSFAGSFQIAWDLNSRESVNGYNTSIKARVTANGSSIDTNTLKYSFSSTEDTHNIKAEANSLEGPDGLGENANDYYWVRYSVKEEIAEQARGAINKYYTITLPSGAILKEVGNGDFTSIGNNKYKFDYMAYQTVYVAYPKNKFGGTTIRHDFELHGTYFDTSSDKILAVSDVSVKPNDYGFTYDGYLYWVGKGGYLSDGVNAIDKDKLYNGTVLEYNLMAIARYAGTNTSSAAYNMKKSRARVNNKATSSNIASNSNATVEKIEININEFTGPNYLDTMPFEYINNRDDFIDAARIARRQYDEAKSIYDNELKQLEIEYANEMANLDEDDDRFGMDMDLVNDLETDETDEYIDYYETLESEEIETIEETSDTKYIEESSEDESEVDASSVVDNSIENSSDDEIEVDDSSVTEGSKDKSNDTYEIESNYSNEDVSLSKDKIEDTDNKIIEETEANDSLEGLLDNENETLDNLVNTNEDLDDKKELSIDKVLDNVDLFNNSDGELEKDIELEDSNDSNKENLKFEEKITESFERIENTDEENSNSIDNENLDKIELDFDKEDETYVNIDVIESDIETSEKEIDDEVETNESIDETIEHKSEASSIESETIKESETEKETIKETIVTNERATPSNTTNSTVIDNNKTSLNNKRILAKMPAKAAAKAANVMNIYLIDDFIDITSSDGTFRQLGDEEYDMVKVTIPSYRSFTNANGFPIQSGKYTAEIVLGTNRNAAAVTSFKIDNNAHTYTFPANTNRFMIRIKNVTESLYINQFDIDLEVKFTLNKSKPIMASGVIRNNDGLIVEYAGEHHNTVFDDSYLGSDANRVRQRDIKTYGTRIQRWYYDYNYESDTTYQDVYVGIGTFIGNDTGYTNTLSLRSQFRKSGGMKGWSVYSLLPLGMKVDKSKLKNESSTYGFSDSFGDTLDNSYMNSGFAIKIIDNYKNSGRTLIEGRYNYNIELDIPYGSASASFDVPVIISYDDFDKYGSSYVIQAEQIANNGGKTSSSFATNKNGVDNGSVFNDTIWSDINNNGNVKEPLVYNSANAHITQVLATQIELKKYVKTPCTSNKYVTNMVNSTTSQDIQAYFGLGYSYKLNILNSGTPAKNVVIYDTLETATSVNGVTSQWRGIFDHVDVSEAQKLGLNPVVWYSTSGNPGKLNSGNWTKTMPSKSSIRAIAIDFGSDRLKPSKDIFVEVFMNAPSADEALVDKQTVNGFNIDYTSFGKNSTLDSNAVRVKVDYPKGILNIKKVDAISKEVLTGYEFQLINSKGQIASIITDKGMDKVNGVNIGTYTLRETKAPIGYNKASDMQVTLVMGSNDVTVEDPRTPGKATLTKRDISDKGLLEGAEYKLYKSDGTLVRDNLVTDSNGTITVEGLEWGDYYFEEIKAPNNHYLHGDLKKKFNINRNALNINLTMDNRRLGTVKLIKVDTTTKETLAGAEFNLYKQDGTLVKSKLISDSNGVINVSGLEWGSYYFEETKAPNNHYLYGNLRTSFNIGDGSLDPQVTVENRRLGTAKLIKKDATDKRPLDGAKFNVYTQTDELVKEGVTSNTNGEVYVDGLVWGEYYFKEIEAPDNHYLYGDARKDFVISKNALDFTSELENRQYGEVELTKYDADDKVTLVNGATYELHKDLDDSLIGTYKTNNDGKIHVDKLEWGNYYFIETEAADGYQINKRKVSFSIYKDDVTSPVKVSTTDEQGLASVSLTKYDSQDRSIKLQGAVFSLQYKLGENYVDVGSYITRENGQLSVNGLKFGEYRFIETKAPIGYKLNDTVIEFSLTRDTVGDTVNLEVENERKLGAIKIQKVDESGIPVEGAVFTLFKGSEIFKDDLISDEYGLVEIGTLNEPILEWGEYTLREKSAPKGYKINTQDIRINIGEVGVEEPHIEKIVNEREKGSVKLIKSKKGDSTIKVSGAVYRLYDTNGVYIAEKSTDVNGEVIFDNIPWGAYYLQEWAAPDPYMVSNDKIRFSINKDNYNVVQVLEAEDDIKTTSLIITKSLEKGSEDIYHAFGNPTFFYRIDGIDATGKSHEYYRSITLSDSELSGTVIISGIPKANAEGYKVTELNALRYGLTEINGTNIKNESISSMSAVADLYNKDSAEVIFTNTLERFDKYSSTMNAVNMVKKSRQLTYLQVEYIGPDNITSRFTDGSYDISKDKEFLDEYLIVKAFYDAEDSKGNISKVLKYGQYTLEPGVLDGQGSAAPYTYNISVKYTEYGSTRRDNFQVSAQVEKPMYVITYHNAYGKNTSSKNDNSKYGTINLYTPENVSGYEFGGWYEDSSLTGTSYNAGGSFTNNDKDRIDLYAKWNPIEYTITYIDGITNQTLVTSNPQKYTIESNDIKLENPSKGGYTFSGWTGSNGTTKQTSVTITKGSTGNKQYVANFDIGKYKITYKYVKTPSAGSGTQIADEVIVEYECGTTKLLIPNEPDGFKFNGWRQGSPSGTLYITGSSITHNDTSSLVMWGDWSEITYKITYDWNGGSPGNQVYSLSYGITSNITLVQPVRDGYTFTGWTGANGSTPQKTVTIPKGSKGDKSYKANWSPVNYTITYNANGGSLSGQRTKYTVESSTYTLPTPKRTGYEFTGWTGSNGNTANTSVTIYKGTTGNKSYTANWKIINYTITLSQNHPKGGTGAYLYQNNQYPASAYKWEFNVETPTFNLDAFTGKMSGYEFLGWTGNGINSPTKSITIPKGTAKNIEYKANWKPLYSEMSSTSLNAAMKELAGTSTDKNALNNNIKAIKITNTIPNGVKTKIVSTNNSPGTITVYFSNGIIYLVSNCSDIRLSSIDYICSGLQSLTDISAFSSIKTNIKSGTMFRSFYACKSLSNLQPLSNWDVSKIYDSWAAFDGCSSLINLNGLNNWNMSSLQSANLMFYGCTKLSNWSAINNWNLTKCSSFTQFARNCPSHPNFTKVNGTWSNGTFTKK